MVYVSKICANIFFIFISSKCVNAHFVKYRSIKRARKYKFYEISITM